MNFVTEIKLGRISSSKQKQREREEKHRNGVILEVLGMGPQEVWEWFGCKKFVLQETRSNKCLNRLTLKAQAVSNLGNLKNK